MLEFEAGFDIDQALIDVREKVDRAKPDLPDEADEPIVEEVTFSRFPVLVVTLAGDVPERRAAPARPRLQDRLEAHPQRARGAIGGDREELVEIVIDPLRVEAYGLQLERSAPWSRATTGWSRPAPWTSARAASRSRCPA